MPGPGAPGVGKVTQDASRSCGQALHPSCISIRRQMVRLQSSVQIPASHRFPTWSPVCPVSRVTALIPLARHEFAGSFDFLCRMGSIPTSRGRSGDDPGRA
ncbi:hypothetical protein TcCL_ESM06653 [Trypanosoma cruzi]|nr:hypothetical protein TcCL_ESM06653 [Trypanosoma cruzi]